MEPIEEQTDLIALTAEQEHKANIKIKVAILKQLHQDGVLTDEQLNILLNMQNK